MKGTQEDGSLYEKSGIKEVSVKEVVLQQTSKWELKPRSDKGSGKQYSKERELSIGQVHKIPDT